MATTKARRSEALVAWMFSAPGVAAFTLFVLMPALAAVAVSFTSWDLIGDIEWAGLDKYKMLLSDPDLVKAARVTGVFVALGVVPSAVLGFAVANLINVDGRFVRWVRGFCFAPMAASSAVVAVLASQLFSRRGAINSLLVTLGLPQPDWLNSTMWAAPAIVLVMCWVSLPLVSILYLAALQRIPREVLEAAQLDGAGVFRRLVFVTWPGVASTTALVLLLQFLTFVGGGLSIALILTEGGPLGATRSLAYYAYEVAFSRLDIGYSSVVALFQLAVVIVIAIGAGAVQRQVRRRGQR
jgi:multiple sugar transport system permease protein